MYELTIHYANGETRSIASIEDHDDAHDIANRLNAQPAENGAAYVVELV